MPAAVLMQDGACGDSGQWAGGGATGTADIVASNSTPDGNALNMQGAIRGLLLITADVNEESPTVGELTFEESHDGVNYVATTTVSRLDAADASDYVATLRAGSIPCVLKIDPLSGPATLRARVSTAFDEPITVFGVAVGR